MFDYIITNYHNKIMTAKYENQKMMEVSFESKETLSMLGNIYVGRVENIVKSINAAFVEVQPGIKCYYSLEENTRHIFLNPKNTDKICQGDLILVQVTKEAVKTKAPIVSCVINFSGKYIAISNDGDGVSISSKLTSKEQKKILKEQLAPYLAKEYKIVVRTNCESLFDTENRLDSNALVQEVEQMIDEYRTLFCIAKTRCAFSLLKGHMPEYLEILKNARVEEIGRVITDIEEYHRAILDSKDKKLVTKLSFYQDKLLPLYKLYSVENQIEEALKKNVWLKCGGYLVVEPTEALTVIDVNSGKFVQGKGNREDGFFKVNMEAAREIAKQIRLRNYSGIIIIDFIDMKESAHNMELIEFLKAEISKDPIQTSFVEITKLGLVELTRHKVKRPLQEQLLLSE